MHCVHDYCTPNRSAIWPETQIKEIVATGEEYDRAHVPSNIPVREGYDGLYARWGLPEWVGAILGIVLPIALLIWAAISSARRRGRAGSQPSRG